MPQPERGLMTMMRKMLAVLAITAVPMLGLASGTASATDPALPNECGGGSLMQPRNNPRGHTKLTSAFVALWLLAVGACGSSSKAHSVPASSTPTPSRSASSVADPMIAQYIATIRPAYTAFYRAASKSSLTFGGDCHDAAIQWTPESRQRCRTDDNASAAAAQQLRDMLATVTPPGALASTHAALLAAAQSSHDSLAVAVATVDHGDHQGFLTSGNAVTAAAKAFCVPIQELDRYTSEAMPIALGCGE